jgi:hypothetical protein
MDNLVVGKVGLPVKKVIKGIIAQGRASSPPHLLTSSPPDLQESSIDIKLGRRKSQRKEGEEAANLPPPRSRSSRWLRDIHLFTRRK